MRPVPVPQQTFLVRLGLGERQAPAGDVVAELGAQLEHHQAQVAESADGGLELRLMITARDLWLALLLALTAATGAGYPPVWIDARAANEVRGRGGAVPSPMNS